MVSAFGREDIKLQVHKYNLDGFLLKPVNPSILFDTVAMVYGKENQILKSSGQGTQDNTGAIKQLNPGRILLVEDNVINQQVAYELLKGFGMSVIVANNGLEALDAVREKEFDLVFMDIQMPKMDGYTATQKIKKMPEGKKLPIVAMTAHAMSGDYEKSLEKGMEGHITKPIDQELLYSILLKWIGPSKMQDATVGNEKEQKSPENGTNLIPEFLPGFDLEDGLQRVGNEQDLFLDLLKTFKHHYGNWADQIDTAMEDNDTGKVCSLVHNIKGVAGNVGAVHLYQSAAGFEAALRENENAAVQDRFSMFRENLVQVMTSLDSLSFDNNKQEPSTGKTGSGNERPESSLLKLFEQYKPFIMSNKPIKARNMVQEISQLELPKVLAPDIDLLNKLVSKYNFQDSLKIMEIIELRIQHEAM